MDFFFTLWITASQSALEAGLTSHTSTFLVSYSARTVLSSCLEIHEVSSGHSTTLTVQMVL